MLHKNLLSFAQLTLEAGLILVLMLHKHVNSRLMSEIVKGHKEKEKEKVKEKSIKCALIEFEVQWDIEKEQAVKDHKARKLQWILYGGKYPE
jgi:hypothetical protein